MGQRKLIAEVEAEDPALLEFWSLAWPEEEETSESCS
jgi:hypothetical protein